MPLSATTVAPITQAAISLWQAFTWAKATRARAAEPFVMTNGSLTTSAFKVGVSAGGQGTAAISGAGTAVIASGQAGVGLGAGTSGTESKLTLSNDAVWIQTGVFIVGGDNFTSTAVTGTGTFEVLSGAEFISSSNLAIGRNQGTGTVLVDGGSISTTAEINLGAFVGGTAYQGGTGTLTIKSGSISASQINVHSGTGAMNFDGGTVTTKAVTENSAASGTVHFNGAVFVAANTAANFFNGFETEDLIIQSGGLSLDTSGYAVTFTQGLSGAGALPGAGTITVAAGGLLDVDYDLTMTTAGLVLEDGSRMILDQNLTFASLVIDGDIFTDGTYDYAALKANYGSIFAEGGSGSITVAVPEPASLVLACLGGGMIAGFLGRRKIRPSERKPFLKDRFPFLGHFPETGEEGLRFPESERSANT